MEEFKVNEQTFRIKKMNAIELLAFRTQIDFNDFNSVIKLYSLILEKVEVKCGDKWLTVKEGNNYYPAGIEEDVKGIQKILDEFLKYLKKVF